MAAPASPYLPPNSQYPVPHPQTAVVDKGVAIAMLIVNIVIPGLGTIIADVLARGPNKMIGRGIAQFVLSIIIVGWVWAIVTGVQLIKNAMWLEDQQGAARAQQYPSAPPPQ